MTDQHPRVYWTPDRSVLVEEGDPRAAFLAYAGNDPIPQEHLDMLHPAPEPEDEPEPAAKPRATRKRS